MRCLGRPLVHISAYVLLTYSEVETRALLATYTATKQTWAYGLRLFALSKGIIGFLFGIMLVPLQASIAFGKSASKAPASVTVLRKPQPNKKSGPLKAAEPDSALVQAAGFAWHQVAEFRTSLIDYAQTLVGRPYRSGGKQPRSGFDCSGFTGYVFRQFGIALPACSRSQSTVGERVGKVDAQPGDLVFFGRKGRRGRTTIYHAGIVASNQGGRLRVIHSASGEGVTVTDMSQPGYWRNHLVAVRRVIDRPAALYSVQ